LAHSVYTINLYISYSAGRTCNMRHSGIMYFTPNNKATYIVTERQRTVTTWYNISL